MIPILYEATETAFTSNGVCRLSDCGICQVTEERNGVYECMFTYPISGKHYDDIQEGRIIFCTHDETGRAQPFDIYARSEPIDGVVTFYAHHVSYRLGRVILQPMTAGSCAQALSAIPNNTYNACPFTFWTDKTVSGAYKNTQPKPVKEALGGSQGSILDVFGKGEYEWDKFNVKLYLDRGTDTDVTIRYGVNMTGYNRDLNYYSAYNACVPFWANSETGAVVTPGVVYAPGFNSTNAEPVVMDLSTEFDTEPTAQEVADMALSRMTSNKSWLPTDNITVSFVPLWQTEEYADVAPLQRVRLCDRVNVIYGPGGVRIEGVQVIRVVYDVLLDRYDSMELGTARATFAQMIQADITQRILDDVPTKSYLQAAIDYATDMIRGGLGGYVYIGVNAAGEPEEICILDRPSLSEAVNVWRWNMGGLGHSSNGYDGPYADVAITMDGRINANLITTGVLNAARVRAGILTDAIGANYWDLDSGEFRLSSTVNWGGTTVTQLNNGLTLAQDTANSAQTAANGAQSTANSAQQAVNSLDNSLNQQEIFNRLTNNGQTQGIYLQNGLLYINASYIQSGTISANRINGGTISGVSININNGQFTVNPSGELTCNDADITGSILSRDGLGSKEIEIVDGEIIGQNGQVIDMRNGVTYNKGIYMGANELDLDITKLYVSLYGDQQLEEGKSMTVSMLDAAGNVQYIRFIHGIFVGYA